MGLTRREWREVLRNLGELLGVVAVLVVGAAAMYVVATWL